MKTTEMSKSKVYQLDEYESGSDIENQETLISQHFSQQPSKKKKGTNKKTGKQKSATPRKRAQSAPPAKVGRDLWINAVKKRQTQTLVRSRPESPRHKTSTEYWVDTLRKTGIGRSTESIGMNTFSGKRPREQDMAYLSTSSYLRQMVGTEKPQKYGDPTTKPPLGTPAYKTPEEYYDQVLELKKVIQGLNQEKDVFKAKIRRIEEDNIKKEKEIAGLLDPKKSDDVRRTLSSKQQDSASVIHSLKQKILKLEVQNRDREAVLVKLQTDLKTTKIDELKQQLEVCFQEIVRLQNSTETGAHKSSSVKSGADKRIKALNEAIIRLSKENEQLKSESHGLKEDLNRQIDEKDINGDYQDMNRKQLLALVRKLEKQKSKKEPSYTADVQGKIALEGSMEERLDQLDKRETELMDKVETQNRQIKKLQDEKNSLYRKLDEKEVIIKELEEQTSGRSPRRSPSTPGRPPTGKERPLSGRSDRSGHGERPSSVRGERPQSHRSVRSERPASSRSDRNEREQQEKLERLRETHAAKKIQRGWRSHHNKEEREQEEHVQKFKENRAAKKIQREWTGYKHRKYEAEYDEAADTITAALKGHQSRQAKLHRFQYYDETESEDDSVTEATDVIFSSLKGHQNRKNKMKTMRNLSDEDETWSTSGRRTPKLRQTTPPSRQTTPPSRMRPGSSHSRASNSSQRSGSGTKKTNYRMTSDYDDDDDIEM